ncbi:MAG TPA: type II toxin-antitoxin system VapC family toxin [Thermoanaerobaculia bacterium]|nr:type II toxin-antitoxin system VapC family toxin [Thermoanaerobaculia bacterium]
MILLDTHIWIWWVHGDSRLRRSSLDLIKEHEASGLGVSIISCWEVAKLVECGRLDLPTPVEEWIEQALRYPGILLLELTPRIVVEATQLPGSFHRDPADQLIVATARVHQLPLATADRKILGYEGAESIDLRS